MPTSADSDGVTATDYNYRRSGRAFGQAWLSSHRSRGNKETTMNSATTGQISARRRLTAVDDVGVARRWRRKHSSAPSVAGGPPVRVVHAAERTRSALLRLSRSLAPGNVALLELAHGNWVTQALYVAAKLNIADQLSGGPLTSDEVAHNVDADPDAIFRLMRALAGKSVLKQRRDGRFALRPMGQALRSDTHGSMRNMVLMFGCSEHWELWGSLLHSVRTGEPATDKLRGMPFFPYLETNPEYAQVFNNAMTGFSELSTNAVVAAYDFTPFRTIVDVGGGHGRLVGAILANTPEAHGILYDLPSVVEGATPTLQAAGVADRCTAFGGSFLNTVPEGGDAYVLKSVIHDWGDEPSTQILRNVRSVIGANGKLLLVEMVLPERASSHFGMMLDLEMLINVGGRERTRADFARVLLEAGFKLTKVVDTVSPLSVIEAVPV
jgi:hypothetical protein